MEKYKVTVYSFKKIYKRKETMNQEHQPIRRIHLNEFKSISRAITTYEDIYLLINHVVERICRSFEVKGCSILLFDERENQLFRVSSYGISEDYLTKGPIFADNKQSAFAKGEPVFVQDMQKDSRVQYPEAAKKEGIVSMLSIPIKFRKAIIGIIRIYHSDPWELEEDDLDSFCLLSEHLGLAIEYNGLKNFLEHVKLGMGNLPLRMLKGL
jgi:transcriptional regulator with GAF, ATPase, and Fis domain